ncbi:hypothetical protein HDV06_006821 [Boothiomyces sp. JEL0866]|nr:hypothetical protein HDV06_006821 [Boothiomyces sp. JEL0866]
MAKGEGNLEKNSEADNPSDGTYTIILRQSPIHARVSAITDKVGDKKPLEPAAIVELKIHEDEAVTAESARLRFQPFLFAYATLVDHQTFEELSFLADESTRILSGVLASSLYSLKDPENPPNFGSFFVFPDISVRKEGVFRLKIALYRMEGGNGDPLAPRKVIQKASIMTEPFEVYSSKSFPAPAAATLLSRSFAEQGLKLKLRKQHRNGGKKDNESSDDESFSAGKKGKKTKKDGHKSSQSKSSYPPAPNYPARPQSYDSYPPQSYRPPPPNYYPNYPPYPYDPSGKPNFPPANIRPGQRPTAYPERDANYGRSYDTKDTKAPSDFKPSQAFPEVHEDDGPLSMLQKAAEYHSSQRGHVSTSSISEDIKSDYNYHPHPITNSPPSKGNDEHKVDHEGLSRNDGPPLKEPDAGNQTVKKRRLEARPRDITRDYTLPPIDGKANVLPPIGVPTEIDHPDQRHQNKNEDHNINSSYERRDSPTQTKGHLHAPYPPAPYYRPPPQYYYPYPPYGYPPHYPPKEGAQDYYRPPYPGRPRPPPESHYPPHYPHHGHYYPPPHAAYPPYYPRPPHREADNSVERDEAHRSPYPANGNSQPVGEYERTLQTTEKKQWPWVKDEQ